MRLFLTFIIISICISIFISCSDKPSGNNRIKLTAETAEPASSWGIYSEADRVKAYANGLPYWEDIIKECFPHKMGDKTLNRILYKNTPDEDKLSGIRFYNTEGETLDWQESYPPNDFTGYRVAFGYTEEYGQYPLMLIIFYSKAGAGEWLETIMEEEKDEIEDIEQYTIGEFIVYKGRIKPGRTPYRWAFYGDYFLLMYPIVDLEHQNEKAALFDNLVEQIDVECIKRQIP